VPGVRLVYNIEERSRPRAGAYIQLGPEVTSVAAEWRCLSGLRPNHGQTFLDPATEASPTILDSVRSVTLPGCCGSRISLYNRLLGDRGNERTFDLRVRLL
jgi:hypothetical protein